MLVLEFIVVFLLFIGLLCTLGARLYGTVIIGVVASCYAGILGVNVFQSWLGWALLLLSLLAECGAVSMRLLFTRHANVTPIYSVNTTVCNIAGIIVSDVLLGSLLGVTLWELIVGKNLFPRLDDISKVLVTLMIIAMVRWICGLLMMIITVKCIMYPN